MSNNPSDTTKTELQTTTPSGQPARRRIATAEAAYAIAKKFDEYDETAAVNRAIIQGMIDGNPPYDPDELEEQGLADMVNVNFLTMRANLDARAAAAHELFIEVPTLIQCVPKASGTGDPDAETYCDIISQEFTDTLLDWPEFLSSMDMVVRESDAYGMGVVLWKDDMDWQFKAFRRGNLRFNPKAGVEVGDNEVITVRDSYKAGDLYDIIENEHATTAGWKLNNVRDLLIRTFIGKEADPDGEDTNQTSSWESLQTQVRNNDLNFQDKQFADVRVRHMLVTEVGGGQRVTHLIIPEIEGGTPVFLFEAPERFERMDRTVWWLPYNYGTGDAASVRGVASFMAPHDDLSNRFLGRVFDAGFLSSGLILSPQTDADLRDMQFMQHGPYTILPPNLKLQQSTFAPQLAPLIQLRGVSEDIMKNNTGAYRQHSEGIASDQVQKTARQVVEESSKEARYEKAAIAHRYTLLDKLYREVLRRLTNPKYHDATVSPANVDSAKAFIKACKDRGVPKAYLTNWTKNFRVHATRALGLGSLGVRYDITNQLLGASDRFDEEGRRNALYDWTEARVGNRNTDRYVSRTNRDLIPSNEQTMATLENNDMLEGSPVPVGMDQMHALHIPVHAQVVGGIVQGLEQGQIQRAGELATGLGLILEHVKGHLEPMARDESRKQLVEATMQLLQIGTQAHAELTRMAEQEAAAAQQAQQAEQQRVAGLEASVGGPEVRAKSVKDDRELTMEEAKQRSLVEIRDRKADADIANKRENSAHQRAMDRERLAADIELQNQAARAKRQASA